MRSQEKIFQGCLKGGEDSINLDLLAEFQNTLAEIFQILLSIALHAHKVHSSFILYKSAYKRSFSYTAPSVDDCKFKLAGNI